MPGLSARNPPGPRGGLARRAGAAGLAAALGGDHRAHRAEDGDQRAELRRRRVHGRLRGRQHPDLGQHGRGPGQPDRRDSSARSSSTNPDGRTIALNDQMATLLVRPRGWHLPEKHMLVDGQPMSGSLFDFGLYFFHNGRAAAGERQRPVLLPAQAGEPPGGAALERRLRASPRRRWACPAAPIKATVLDRDDPGRLRDGRDPVRAARAQRGPERGALGLHVQRDQEVRRAGRSSCCPTGRRSQ